MKRLVPLIAALTLFIAACEQRPTGSPLAELSISDVSVTDIEPGATVSVTGTGFYGFTAGGGPQVEVCGLTITADLIEPISQLVLLPPAGAINVLTGSVLSFTVPADAVVNGTSPTLTITRPDGATVSFEGIGCGTVEPPRVEPEQYMVQTATSGQGSIALDPETDTFETGTEVTLTAVPAAGWYFDHWEGDLDGAANPATLVVDGNSTVTAHFLPEFEELTAVLLAPRVNGGSAETYEVNIQNLLPIPVHVTSFELQRGDSTVYTTFNIGENMRDIAPGGGIALGQLMDPPEPMANFAEWTVHWHVSVDEFEHVVVGDFRGAIAVATASQGRVTEGSPVVFDASASVGQGALQYQWAFPDSGETVEGVTVTRVFNQTGTHTASLTVTDESNNSGTAEVTVEVAAPIDGVIAPALNGPYAPSSVTFGIDQLSGGFPPYEFAWQFGPTGDPIVEANPTVQYDEPGEFTVGVLITDAEGNEFTATTEFELLPLPPVDAVLTSTSGTVGERPFEVVFDASASSGPGELHYSWREYGSTETFRSTSPHLTRTFDQAGEHTMELTVSDAYGQSDVATYTFTVFNPLLASPQAVAGDSGSPLEFSFSQSEPTVGLAPVTFIWDFGDGAMSTLEAPSHKYEEPGTYTVTLTLEDARGMTSTSMLDVEASLPSHRISFWPEQDFDVVDMTVTPVGGGTAIHISSLTDGGVTLNLMPGSYQLLVNELSRTESYGELEYTRSAKNRNYTFEVSEIGGTGNGYILGVDAGAVRAYSSGLPPGIHQDLEVTIQSLSGGSPASPRRIGSERIEYSPGVYRIVGTPVSITVPHNPAVATMTAEPIDFALNSHDDVSRSLVYEGDGVPLATFEMVNSAGRVATSVAVGEQFTVDASRTFANGADDLEYSYVVVNGVDSHMVIEGFSGVSTDPVRSHAFEQPGTYTLRLFVYFQVGSVLERVYLDRELTVE